MRTAVVDVGSNTVRLLVAELQDGRLRPLRQERAALRLGASVERHGRLSDKKIQETARCVRLLVRKAESSRAQAVEVLITSPGRQARNGDALLSALAETAGVPVRQLSAEEEGLLAYEGALACTDPPAGSVAVCDVGGGSTQITVGTAAEGAAWLRSLDIGSLRLTRRLLPDDPPGRRAAAAAEAEVRSIFEGFAPPLPQTALAVGGTARALRRLLDNSLDEAGLARLEKRLAKLSVREIVRTADLEQFRARTLLGGTLILAEVQRRLGLPLTVVRGGVREGAAARLLAGRLAA